MSPWHCFSALHVRHDSYRGILPEAGHAGGLACGIHDGLHPFKSAADHLQRGIGNDGTGRAHHHLFPVRLRSRITGFSVLPGQRLFQLYRFRRTGESRHSPKPTDPVSFESLEKCESDRTVFPDRHPAVCTVSAIRPSGCDGKCLRRKQGLGRADGGNDRRASLCLWRRDDPSSSGMAVKWYEHGICGGIYDHRACNKDHQSRSPQDRDGAETFPALYSLRDGFLVPVRHHREYNLRCVNDPKSKNRKVPVARKSVFDEIWLRAFSFSEKVPGDASSVLQKRAAHTKCDLRVWDIPTGKRSDEK